MFSVVYRWKIRPELEDKFRLAWRGGTVAIRRDLGGLGSRLHRIGPGEYFAYAQWPDEASYRAAREGKMSYDDPEARQAYLEALEGSETDVVVCGEVVEDLLAGP